MTHVALLRAVNVAGRNRVKMADLRALLEDLGLADVRSLLQSGNLVFDCSGRDTGELELLLERGAADRLQLETAFFVRAADEWDEIVSANPFPTEAERDPGHLLMMCLKEAPDAGKVAELEAAIVGRETVRARGRELYLVYPDGIGRSNLTAALIERKLTTQGTARNWNTTLKISALVAG